MERADNEGMQTFYDFPAAQPTRPTALTIGNFDGLHRGHQALLSALKEVAFALDAASSLVTFDPHPLTVLRPDAPNPLLTTPQERLHLAAAQAVDLGIILPFTHELAALEPEAFIGLLARRLNLVALVVGPDFALGRNRRGDLDLLTVLGAQLGYRVHVIAPIAWGDQPVRSSVIRSHLRAGEVVAAGELLGRRYHATGLVVQGDQRGRTIGIPTANLQIAAGKLWPADGVYATQTYIHDWPGRPATFNSVTNLGHRPTVGGLEHRFETHLLDFPPPGDDDNLYGRTLTVEFVARLRAEQRFGSLAELVAQIHRDIAQARTLLPDSRTMTAPLLARHEPH